MKRICNLICESHNIDLKKKISWFCWMKYHCSGKRLQKLIMFQKTTLWKYNFGIVIIRNLKIEEKEEEENA